MRSLPILNLSNSIFAAMVFTLAAHAQTPAYSGDTFYQIGYASNVTTGDSYVNISNDGASMTTTSTVAATNSLAVSGSLCVNVYAFDPDEEILSCCSCPITPNGLVSLSVQNDLLNNTLTGRPSPTSVVIKLYASAPGGAAVGTTSNPCALSAGNLLGQAPAVGMVAWATKLHANTSTTTATYSLTETPFTPAAFNVPEILRLNSLCAFNLAQGSTYGICNSCELTGQGAAASNQ
jgi:hypothetical protein